MFITVLEIVLFAAMIGAKETAADGIKNDNGWPVAEYCTGETFRPRCAGGKSDVIVVLNARYGRMDFGRCLKKQDGMEMAINNPKFLGCWADVKDTIDRHCSGKSECDVRINDQNFEAVKPCYDDLKMHLEASYACVRVVAENRHCTVTLTNEPQHIVVGSRSPLAQSDRVGCGTESQPWSIEGLAGQRISVSKINFGADRNDSSVPQQSCSHSSSGYIIDRSSRRNVSICREKGSPTEKEQFEGTPLLRIYVSTSNRLQIVARIDAREYYIIRVEAVGCSDLTPPSNDAWLKRVDDQITIGCYMTRQSWQLSCVDGAWTGTVGACTESADDLPDNGQSSFIPTAGGVSFGKSSEMAALVAVASTGIALCSIVICMGIFCLNRQRRPSTKNIDATSYRKGGNFNATNQLNIGSHC